MANATPSYAGQINGAGDTKAIFLKIYGGEVLTAFQKNVMAMNKTLVRNISNGKSAAFPATWRQTAAYHTPGVEITGNTILGAERVISVDDMLISPVFIPVIDEAMAHFEYRSIYSTESGLALAYQLDKNILQTGVLAARAAALITASESFGGSQLINAGYKTDSSTLAGGFFAAAQKFDEKAVSEEGREAYLLPAQYYLLAQNTTLINQQYGGAGAIKDGTIFQIAGININKTLHLPSTNINTGPSQYQVNATNTAALIMQKNAVGTVKLLDMAVESEYDIRRQGTLIVAKVAVGTGILRPELAIELATA